MIENNPLSGLANCRRGETSELNIEAIIGLAPDAVLVHHEPCNEGPGEKLNPLGIPVIRIDNYQPENMRRNCCCWAGFWMPRTGRRRFWNPGRD